MDRARKRELRKLNERIWEGETEVFPVNASLDSSLKKNTAFIKRLRTTVTAATLNTFLLEIRTLSLHRYLSEITAACYEGLCKLKSSSDFDAGTEVVSALHQRFGHEEFTESLVWLLSKGMAGPEKNMLKSLPADIREKEEKDRISRQRVLLRVVTDLWLVGVLRTLDDARRPAEATKGASGKVPDIKIKSIAAGKTASEPFPLDVLKELLGHDREHVNLPILVMFVKTFAWDVLGKRIAAAETRRTGDEEDGIKAAGEEQTTSPVDPISNVDSSDDSPFTTPEVQEKFRSVLRRYFEDVARHVVRDQKAIASQARRNSEAYIRSGEMFEDRQASFDKQVRAHERLVANTQTLADAIDAEMPEMDDSKDSAGAANGAIGLVKTGEYLRGQSDGAGIWEDEDERYFYENLVDLKGKVPDILLEDTKKKKPEQDEQVGRRVIAGQGTAETPKTNGVVDEQSVAIANKSVGAQVDAILSRFPELVHKEAVDEVAVDFCFLNSKASRNRLIKHLQDVPKGRGDLLPFWARLVATLGRYMPDIPKALVEHLDAEFRSLQRRKDKDFLGQVRLVNIRYLAELTKFGIVPEHVVFHCLKVSLEDFSRMNIEIICDLLENCGRYLLRNPETSPRMAAFLETLRRKKSALIIGQQERLLIENAVYFVDPPERPAIQQKERSPMELFIRKLVWVDLTKRNHPKILKQLRRLHWEDRTVVDTLMRIFTKPVKVKFGNVFLLAVLLGALYKYHPEFAVRVVDDLMESISLGLEQNDFRYNQRRIAEAKYLAELYNYRMVDHPVIFDTLYRIMTFGWGGPPLPGRLNPYDMPDDFFRVRLAATILETCGMYFNKGAAGRKLDYFLSFFQYYIYTKPPLPMDIEFTVKDLFQHMRPQWKLASNFDEAAKVFQMAVAQDQKLQGVEKPVEPDDGTSGASSEVDPNDDDDDDDDDPEWDDGEAVEEQQEQLDEHSDAKEEEVGVDGEEVDEEEEEIVVTREDDVVDPEVEAEFEREYARMIAESMESRKFERKPLFDAPVPVMAKIRDAAPSPTVQPVHINNESNDHGISKMAFALLTKRGNRQQTRTVELPADSNFAVAMRHTQQVEREEQLRIKNLVLNYDMRDNDEIEGYDRPPTFHQNRVDRSAKGGQRIRKLQLSDVDWYD